MLKIKIIAVGGLKEAYFRDAAAEYLKRLGLYCKCEVVEIQESRLAQEPSAALIEAALNKESELILRAAEGYYTIALCIGGKRFTSEGFAAAINKAAVGGVSQMAFVIGSSHGLSKRVENAADLKISLSDMTLPHQLCRVFLLEQLYRAFSINGGGKYHK